MIAAVLLVSRSDDRFSEHTNQRGVNVAKYIVAVIVALAVVMPGVAADEDLPSMSIKGSLELFYELSEDVGGHGDVDKFKSNELYVDFTGKFDWGLGAKLKLDGADIVSSDGKFVTEKIVEEANFSAKHIGGSPVTLVFGKDEMPFGSDYDKYLNDSIAHQFELDKVWGFHGIVDIPHVGNVAGAVFQHRHADDDEIEPTNEAGDNVTGKLTIDKLVKNLVVKVSGALVSYSDTATTDPATGITTVSTMNDEIRWGAGAIYKVKGIGNVNAEYIGFNDMSGHPGYHPSLLTLGIQCDVIDKTAIWGRYEIIGENTPEDVETDFWSVGVKHSPTKNFDLLLEYSNFNSGDMKDATDLKVAKGSTEDSLLVGVKAKF